MLEHAQARIQNDADTETAYDVKASSLPVSRKETGKSWLWHQWFGFWGGRGGGEIIYRRSINSRL